MSDLTKQLPVEILSKIFQSLSLQDLSTVVLVCRRWREVVETLKLWSELTEYKVQFWSTDCWMRGTILM